MTPVSSSTLLEALNWRYATKKFDASKKIPSDTWKTLEQALVLAPSSFGLQPWKFIIVQDPALRTKLSAAAWGQTQPVDCSHFVVFVGRKDLDAGEVDRFIQRTADVRHVDPVTLKGYRDVIAGSVTNAKSGGYLDVWQSRQVYIALGQFMAAAALLGVDACPMEGFNPAQFDAILGLDTARWGTLCACAAGYRASDDKYASLEKVRYSASDVIEHR